MPKITLDDLSRERLLREGELRVEDVQGIAMVLMTVDARQELHRVAYDEGEWTEEEMLSVAARQLVDSEGWGAPEMEIYDELYGDKPTDDGNDQ